MALKVKLAHRAQAGDGLALKILLRTDPNVIEFLLAPSP
jgi:hypothetical protein